MAGTALSTKMAGRVNGMASRRPLSSQSMRCGGNAMFHSSDHTVQALVTRVGPQNPRRRGGLNNESGVLLQGLRREFSNGQRTEEEVRESPH